MSNILKHSLILIAAMLIVNPVFADDDDMDSTTDRPCGMIAKACIDAGYTRQADEGKKFWKDCFKPTLLGKTVTGVTVDVKDVKACRTDKIAKMKKEIEEFRNAR